MSNSLENLIIAEEKAKKLFQEIENRNLIQSGIFESELNTSIYKLAYELFQIETYWHKRIVRAGENTLFPYNENPIDRILNDDDILFLDFGPIFEEWEADFGRTFVIGNNSRKIKLKNDVEIAWHAAKAWILSQEKSTGSEVFAYLKNLAKSYDWEFGGEIGGHLIGKYPHEKLEPKNYSLYIHPENHSTIFSKSENNFDKNWILEIHFIDLQNRIGGFFEQVLF
jgi:Xaa-Pro aminopeptidase